MDNLFLKIDSEPVPAPDVSMPSSSTSSTNSSHKSINSTELGWPLLARRYNIPQNVINDFPGGANLFLKWMLWEDSKFDLELTRTTLQDYFEAKSILNLSTATWLQRDIKRFESRAFNLKSYLSIVRFIADLIQHKPAFPTKDGPAPAVLGSETYQSITSTCCSQINYYHGSYSSDLESALKAICLSDFSTFKLVVGKFCAILPKINHQSERTTQASTQNANAIVRLKQEVASLDSQIDQYRLYGVGYDQYVSDLKKQKNFKLAAIQDLVSPPCSGPFQASSSNARSGLSKDLPQLLACLPKDTTLVAMGSSEQCNKQLLTLMWPYYALFQKACPDHKERSYTLPQPLDLGYRLTPKALKNIVGYFYTGTADFSRFDAMSVLLHAEELRMMDGQGKGLRGFESLIAHLRLVTKNKLLTIPNEEIGYGIALGSQDEEIWTLSIETWRANFSDAASSSSIDWLFHNDWDLFWRATCELLNIKPTADKV